MCPALKPMSGGFLCLFFNARTLYLPLSHSQTTPHTYSVSRTRTRTYIHTHFSSHTYLLLLSFIHTLTVAGSLYASLIYTLIILTCHLSFSLSLSHTHTHTHTRLLSHSICLKHEAISPQSSRDRQTIFKQ